MKQAHLKNVTTLKLNTDKCSGCSMCTVVCPHEVFKIISRKAIIDKKDNCMECGACMNNCPENAIYVKTGVGCATAIILSAVRGNKGEISCGKENCC